MSVIMVRIFEDFLGHAKKHSPSSGQMAFDCPACADEKGMPEGDGKGNLEVNYNLGLFRCWSCSDTNHMKGGIPFLIKRYGNSEILSKYFSLRPEGLAYEKGEKVEISVKLPKEFKKFSDCNGHEYKYSEAYKYIKDRGITDRMIKKYDIGYCPSGEYHNRIIIPSYDRNNVLNYFIARSFNKKIFPKYKNPEAEKSEIIFNERFLNFDSTIYLVEGVFDHLVIPNSIPILGKYPTKKLKLMLHKYARANIVILLDSDAIEDATEIYKELNTCDLYNRVKMCVPPSGEDPSSYFEKYKHYGIYELIRTSYRIQESEIY